jgi:hypothetical protein
MFVLDLEKHSLRFDASANLNAILAFRSRGTLAGARQAFPRPIVHLSFSQNRFADAPTRLV